MSASNLAWHRPGTGAGQAAAIPCMDMKKFLIFVVVRRIKLAFLKVFRDFFVRKGIASRPGDILLCFVGRLAMANPNYVGMGVRSSNGGMGVFIHERVPAGTRILEFTGKRLSRVLVDRAVTFNKPDYYLQVGENEFMGPSGLMDDYVNHSCHPNSGLEFERGRIFMKSLRDISFGTELTIDYATTQSAFPLRFSCKCGHRNCRGIIGNYNELPPHRQAYYRSRNVIAPYLLTEAEDEQDLDVYSIPKHQYSTTSIDTRH